MINLVNGIDCSALPFDDVMDVIINADTTVDMILYYHLPIHQNL